AVFRCISLCKHPEAPSQAVKLLCTNKPSSLTAKKTSSRSVKMTHSSLVFESGVMAAKQAGWLTSLASPPKDSHYRGHYIQRRRRDNTNSVLEPCRASVERSASPRIVLPRC
ncbi:hypothetical protein GBF38_021279, partial [Nibea albiflora]